MYTIRTIQYAILAFVLVVATLHVTISGSAYLFFNKFLGFNPSGNLGERAASDSTYLILFAIMACLLLALEFFRVRLVRRRMDTE